MRQRPIALAATAAVLVTAPLMVSCRRPPPPGNVTALPAPILTNGGKDCGTITVGEPTTDETTAIENCFLAYHFGAATTYIKTVEVRGVETITTVYQAHAGHSVTVTKQTVNTATGTTKYAQKACTGGGAQVLVDYKTNTFNTNCTTA
jgi:hypothetical protein